MAKESSSVPTVPPHHRAGRGPEQADQGAGGVRLRVLQPKRHQPHPGAQGLLHLLQGLLACRCFGYMISKKKYIYTIDDDCFVAKDPSVHEGSPTVVSHGLWLNIPDYDAPTQLVKPCERNTRYVDAILTIPKGTLFPLCGMNHGL
ncbi:hypothetical protein OPV22_027733 [Ensete ventricosum]|uniref:Hexosyltransferase n=1 Tax=Ensete ventricosum TaxID=4639 RepID=A0AAV8P4F9_ENSVE|nr:hypothetical protein OPV22_027733 [Ensete ventricosum]